MLYSVETGSTGFEKALGAFRYSNGAQHLPRTPHRSSETMIGVHGAEPAAVAAAYDFSRSLTTIVGCGRRYGIID